MFLKVVLFKFLSFSFFPEQLKTARSKVVTSLLIVQDDKRFERGFWHLLQCYTDTTTNNNKERERNETKNKIFLRS